MSGKLEKIRGLAATAATVTSARTRGRSTAPAAHRTPAPVVVALDDPVLLDEVTLVTAVTGRDLLTWSPHTDLPAGTDRVILVTTGPPGPGEAAAADLTARGVAVRPLTVTLDPAAEATAATAAAALLLPAEATALAARIGTVDHPDCTVYGAVGGAGTSTFAAALAGALAEPDLGGDGQALLVETSGHPDLDHLLGLEDAPGRRLPDLAGTPALTADRLGDLPWSGDVAVLAGVGAAPEFLDTCCPVVRDGGRWGAPATGVPAVTGTPVLVVPATVPGTLSGRAALAHLPGAAVVLREVPRAELEWNDALTLLGRAPEVTWQDDPFLTGETDRGGFGASGSAAGTAGTAAARLVTAMAGRL